MPGSNPEFPEATMANMRRLYEPGVFAFSPLSMDECSANPADYFWMSDDDALTGPTGERYLLAIRQTTFAPPIAKESAR